MKRIIPCIVLMLVLFGCMVTKTQLNTASGSPDTEGWTTLSANGFTLIYKVDGADLHCKLTGFTTGWIALGIAPTMMMKDANFIIGYVIEDEGYIRDDYGNEPTDHIPDLKSGGSEDVKLISYSETKSTTSLEFSLPLDSDDIYDRTLSKGNTYKVIFATGPEDDFDSYHLKKASGTIKL
jgi:hypothetical protein